MLRYFSFMNYLLSTQIAYTTNGSWNCALSFTRSWRNMYIKTPSYSKWYDTVEKHNCYSLRLIMALWIIAVVPCKPGWSQSFWTLYWTVSIYCSGTTCVCPCMSYMMFMNHWWVSPGTHALEANTLPSPTCSLCFLFVVKLCLFI